MRGTTTAVDFFSKDMLVYIRSKWVYILLIALFFEILMVGASAVTTRRYIAEASVLLGDIPHRTEGSQGMIVERVRNEMNAVHEIIVRPKANGSIYILVESEDPELAVDVAMDAARRLVDYSEHAVEIGLRDLIYQQNELEKVLKSLNEELSILNEKKIVEWNEKNYTQYMFTMADMKEKMDFLLKKRVEIRSKLFSTKIEDEYKVRHPAILTEASVPKKAYRPDWTRNMVVGGIFGVSFGLFIVFLFGVFHRINIAMTDENSIDKV